MLSMGFQCMGIYDKEKLIGICGLWVLCKFYNGKHIEPDNVVIDPEYRNRGLGQILMKAVDQYAMEMNCVVSELNVYMSNIAGQSFWAEQDYKGIGIHMQKTF
jgi:GNAT superfamily N-acetyltransferase